MLGNERESKRSFLDGIHFFNFPELDIKAAISKDPSKVYLAESYMEKIAAQNGIDKLPLDSGEILLLSAPTLEIFTLENPYKTGSPSDADYLAKYEDKGRRLLIQYLRPRQTTSHHLHGQTTETFEPMFGDFFIWYNQLRVITVATRIIVGPMQSHIGFTIDNPAITLIIQEGPNFEHQYLVKPDVEFLIAQAKLLEKSS